MIRTFWLENFKAIANLYPLPIKPITLVFGANSSGKSSLLHGLLMAHHAITTGDVDVVRPTLAPGLNLGGIENYLHSRDILHRSVTFGIDIDGLPQQAAAALTKAPKSVCVLVTVSAVDPNLDWHYEHLLENDPLDEPCIDYARMVGYRVLFDGIEVLDFGPAVTESLDLRSLNTDHPSLAHPSFRRVPEKWVKELPSSGFGDSANQPTFELIDPADGLLPAEVTYFGGGQSESGLDWADDLAQGINSILGALRAAVAAEVKNLRYLGPIRVIPERGLNPNAVAGAAWSSGGGSAWDRLARDQGALDAVNEWLSSPDRLQTPFRLQRRAYRDIESPDFKQSLAKALVPLVRGVWELAQTEDSPDAALTNDEITYGGSGPSAEDHIARRFLDDALAQVSAHFGAPPAQTQFLLLDKLRGVSVSPRDVGVGISQVLPILVEAFGSSESIIAIEQPELHIHPGLQAELADVFIASALGERRNRFLLETHSEHLILRVLRRIRETASGRLKEGLTPIKPEDVAVLYVKAGKPGSTVTEIPVTEDGDFAARWPDGFFAERAAELF